MNPPEMPKLAFISIEIALFRDLKELWLLEKSIRCLNIVGRFSQERISSMSLDTITIADIPISRFILGSNPFCGFSHQTPQKDTDMKRYYTTAKIKETIRDAEALGIDTMIARTDFHVMRLLLEYRDEGGGIHWFAQTCPEVAGSDVCVERAYSGGALACHIHGGVMDNLFARKEIGEIPGIIRMIREKGMAAGRNDPEEAFAFAVRKMRTGDALCVGVYTRDKPDMLKQDVKIFQDYLLKKR
jgi:hypothetical protein